MQCNAMQRAMQYNAKQRKATTFNIIQRNANATQRNATQHNTTQRSATNAM